MNLSFLTIQEFLDLVRANYPEYLIGVYENLKNKKEVNSPVITATIVDHAFRFHRLPTIIKFRALMENWDAQRTIQAFY